MALTLSTCVQKVKRTMRKRKRVKTRKVIRCINNNESHDRNQAPHHSEANHALYMHRLAPFEGHIFGLACRCCQTVSYCFLSVL